MYSLIQLSRHALHHYKPMCTSIAIVYHTPHFDEETNPIWWILALGSLGSSYQTILQPTSKRDLTWKIEGSPKPRRGGGGLTIPCTK